jgi:hypothetical protein
VSLWRIPSSPFILIQLIDSVAALLASFLDWLNACIHSCACSVCPLGFPSACPIRRSTTEAPGQVLTSAALVLRPPWCSGVQRVVALDRSPRLLCTAAPPIWPQPVRRTAIPALCFLAPRPLMRSPGLLDRFDARLSPLIFGYSCAQSLRGSTALALCGLGRLPARRVQRSPALRQSGARPLWRNTLHVFVHIFYSCVQ